MMQLIGVQQFELDLLARLSSEVRDNVMYQLSIFKLTKLIYDIHFLFVCELVEVFSDLIYGFATKVELIFLEVLFELLSDVMQLRVLDREVEIHGLLELSKRLKVPPIRILLA